MPVWIPGALRMIRVDAKARRRTPPSPPDPCHLVFKRLEPTTPGAGQFADGRVCRVTFALLGTARTALLLPELHAAASAAVAAAARSKRGTGYASACLLCSMLNLLLRKRADSV